MSTPINFQFSPVQNFSTGNATGSVSASETGRAILNGDWMMGVRPRIRVKCHARDGGKQSAMSLLGAISPLGLRQVILGQPGRIWAFHRKLDGLSSRGEVLRTRPSEDWAGHPTKTDRSPTMQPPLRPCGHWRGAGGGNGDSCRERRATFRPAWARGGGSTKRPVGRISQTMGPARQCSPGHRGPGPLLKSVRSALVLGPFLLPDQAANRLMSSGGHSTHTSAPLWR